MLHGEVKVSYMTEEERLAYIKKHPIVPTKKLQTPFGYEFMQSEKNKARRSEAIVKARAAKAAKRAAMQDGDKTNV